MYNNYSGNLRDLIVGVNTRIPLSNGQLVTGINFDNAATTPPFVTVLQAIMNFSPWYSSIHRGTGYKSQYASDFYENSRDAVKSYVNAGPENTVIYVKNTSEAINKLSFRLCSRYKHHVILSTFMEHHSNDLPWRDKYYVDYIDIDKQGRLILEDAEKKLRKHKGNVKLVTVTGASNVTGYKNPIYDIAKLAHKYDAKIMVDAAQLIAHSAIDMRPAGSPEHIDYLVFSAHKMYAPFGTGVLIGPIADFEKGEPDYKGGGTIDIVTHDQVKWASPPHKDEAGTPNVMGTVALLEAIKTITSIGIDRIEKYETGLIEHALQRLNQIPGIELIGKEDCCQRVGIIPFNIAGVPHQVVASALAAEAGISVRNGCFCAQPYVQKLLGVPRREIRRRMKNPSLPHPGLVRLSFGLYNTRAEIDILAEQLKYIDRNKDTYLKRYQYVMESE